jgi:capsular polysaccharide transport system ATP-binding protein
LLAERLKHANLILTSHNMADIRQYCNVVLHVDDGKVDVHEDIEAGIRAYQGGATEKA